MAACRSAKLAVDGPTCRQHRYSRLLAPENEPRGNPTRVTLRKVCNDVGAVDPARHVSIRVPRQDGVPRTSQQWDSRSNDIPQTASITEGAT